jgi:O-antigen/teichoic acid export membrane protein
LNKIVIPLITALGTVLIPRMAVAMKNGAFDQLQKLFDQSFWFVCFFAIPISAGIFIFSPELIDVFVGDSFNNAIVPMRIMSPLVIVIGIAHILSSLVLIPGGKEKQYFIAVSFGTTASVIMNFTLVPGLLATGAAIANIMTEIIVTGISCFFVFKYYHLEIRWKKMLYNLCIVAVFYLIGILCRSVWGNSFMILAGAIPICVVYYMSFHLFVAKDKILWEFIHNGYANIKRKIGGTWVITKQD